MRKVGDILLDMELLLDELTEDHEMQWGDILSIIHAHLMVHNPESREEYLDNSHPIFYYGPGDKNERDKR